MRSPITAILVQPLQQLQVASSSCCSAQPFCQCLGLGPYSYTPHMGIPGVTSLLPGCLQRLQVTPCSDFEVPAGKASVKSAFWPCEHSPCYIKDLTCLLRPLEMAPCIPTMDLCTPCRTCRPRSCLTFF